MKVMLINPSTELIESSRIYGEFVSPIPPLGIVYIASVLKKNSVDVIVIDQYAYRMSDEELLNRIRQEEPRVIGFSCLTPGINKVKKLIERVKTLNLKEKIWIILGNVHATIFADELIRKRVADVVVRGEGEFSMLEIVLAIKEGKGFQDIRGISFCENGKVQHNPEREQIKDLDNLPYPAWHLLELKHYNKAPLICLYDIALPIQASRGCPYQCTFCAQDSIFKKPRYRQINKIIDEIEYLHKRFKITFFGFIDPYFPFSIRHGLEFCNELMRRGLHKKIRWIIETRVDLVNLELLIAMKRAGLYLIQYGFEVGNQKILDSLKKKTTLEQAREAMRETKKAGILTLGLFMLGMPGENKKTCKETIRFAKELDCDIAKFNLAVPYPGSELFEIYKDRLGRIEEPEKFTPWYDWSSFSGESVLIPDGMSYRELTNLQREAMFQYYVRPKLILRHIFKRTIGIKHLCYGAYILIIGYFKILINKINSKFNFANN